MLNPVGNEQINAKQLAEIARLRRFTGPPAEFWPGFLAAAAGVAGAARAVLILKDAASSQWKKLGEWAGSNQTDRTVLTFNRQLVEVGERCIKDGNIVQAIESSATPELKHFVLATKLQLSRPEDNCIAVYLLLNATDQQAAECLVRLQLVSDAPQSYLSNHAAGQAKADVEKFAASLDVMVLLNAEKKFLGAAMALANAIATRYQCDRASIGWLEGDYIKLKTISRTEKFDKNMAAVKALEMTMEESFDQDDEIIHPAPDGATFVARDHEKFAREQTSGNICSLPIRVDGKPVAVLTCERQARPFNSVELQQLRLACDQVARRLSDLKRNDGWIGVRAANGLKEKFAVVLGPERTWLKVGAITGTLALIVLFFFHFNYRVEGNFILRSDDVSFLTAPFDGYIKEVSSKPGDTVQPDVSLLKLDTDELNLEEAAAVSEQVRYMREAEKARATNGLAEMRIALSMADQAKARLDTLRYRIERASIKSPFAGIVVDGDLRERIGSPVKQGDALFKVSKMDTLYIEAEVNQRDIHELKTSGTGEISFVTQPKLKYPVKIDRIYPAAMPKDGENIFIVRCELLAKPDGWWRPGMSGLVKLEAGERTLFWMLTHRTVDFLRLWLWW
ncbi:MAG: efflux RND transporter periplasmic adaptor subunit [Verrucomicrobiales bacterium]